ncbi:MAG: hypothetical protein JXR07_10290 [Reichenbachiella sp.]
MKQSTLILLFSIFLIGNTESCFSQDSLRLELDALNAELDAIFANESDSLSLMALIDNLVNMEPDYSELQLRIGYSSRVTSAGRDFGIDQQGITPGISYYHKSGFFTDISGFWNSEFDPKYNLSVLTLGYLGRIKKKTTYSISYDHSFYSDKDSTQTLTNSFSGALTHYFKYFYSGVDYSYSFGTETASRLIWNVTGNIKTKGFGPFTRISFLPSVAILFGNENITTQYINPTNVERFENMSRRQLYQFSQSNNIPLRTLDRTQQALINGNITDEELAQLSTYFTTTNNYETFELLNYYFTLPIVFNTKKLSIYISYNYNIPRNLSDDVTYEPNGYFGFAIAYNIKL